MRKFVWMVMVCAAPALGSPAGSAVPVPRGCTGSISLGSFRIAVLRSPDAPALPLKSVSLVPPGSRLIWDPVHLPPQSAGKEEVAALLVPAGGSSIVALGVRKAAGHAEWDLPQSPGVVALIVGPSGLSMSKVK